MGSSTRYSQFRLPPLQDWSVLFPSADTSVVGSRPNGLLLPLFMHTFCSYRITYHESSIPVNTSLKSRCRIKASQALIFHLAICQFLLRHPRMLSKGLAPKVSSFLVVILCLLDGLLLAFIFSPCRTFRESRILIFRHYSMIPSKCFENLSMYRHDLLCRWLEHFCLTFSLLISTTSVTSEHRVIDTIRTILSGHQAANCFRFVNSKGVSVDSLPQYLQNKGNRLTDRARGRPVKETRSRAYIRKSVSQKFSHLFCIKERQHVTKTTRSI